MASIRKCEPCEHAQLIANLHEHFRKETMRRPGLHRFTPSAVQLLNDVTERFQRDGQALRRKTTMALKIDPDGTETVMEPESKHEGFHTETLQKAVGGHIEVVTLPRLVEHEGEKYYALICDENGKRKNLNVNDRATVLWAKAHGVPVGSWGDYLVGTVLFVKKGEVT